MIQVERTVIVNRPRPEVYAYWRDFTNLPTFMDHLVAVEYDADAVSHWTAKAPIGTVEWDAKIVEDKPAEMISWRSLDGSEIKNSGAVRFFDAPGGGTEVTVNLTYDPPGGAIGKIVARLFGEEPDQQVHDDLNRFKQILESGDPASASTVQHKKNHDDDDVSLTDAHVPESGLFAGIGLAGAGGAVIRGADFDETPVESDVPEDVWTEDNFGSRRGLKTGTDSDKYDPNDRDLIKRTT